MRAILDQDGPDYFRRCEERHILQHTFPPSVIATGGSVVYSQAAMEHLKQDATVVFLNVSYENLCQRIRNFSTRGILTHGSSLLDLYHERLPLYERYADIILDCLDQTIEETVEAVVGRPEIRSYAMLEYQFQSDCTISNLRLLFCGTEQCAPSHSYGPAARPYYLLHHVLKGKGTFSCCGKEYSLQPGQGFLIVPGQVTRYQADAADPWQYLWIAIDRQGAKSLFDSTTLSAHSPIYTAPPSHPLHSVFLSLTQALQQQTLNSFALLSSFFSIFFPPFPAGSRPGAKAVHPGRLCGKGGAVYAVPVL